MLGLLLLVLSVLACTVQCYYYPNEVAALRSAHFTQSSLSRAKPLSTAGLYTAGSLTQRSDKFIPRLEPGMRPYKQATNEPVTISTFSLDWLKDNDIDRRTPFLSIKEVTSFIKRIVIEAYAKFGGLLSRLLVIDLFGKFQGLFGFCVKKVAALSIIAASALSRFNLNGFGAQLAAASSVVATVGGGAGVARASALKQYKDLSATERLSTTPLYYVCNSRGNSYLQDDVQAGNPEQKIVVYFMSSEDANDYLNEMSQVNSFNANEFRIMSVSFEKVYNQIVSRKQSRKIGRYDLDMIYRIQPSARQLDNAEMIRGGGKPEKALSSTQDIAIPMFTAKGLGIKRATGEVVVPYYFAYEDLKEDWNKMQEAAPEGSAASKEPKVVVKDWTEVMVASAGMSKESLKQYSVEKDGARVPEASSNLADAPIGIVPPRREIDMIKRFYRNQGGMKNEFGKAKILGMQ